MRSLPSLLVLGALCALAGCSPDDAPEIIGTWENGLRQRLSVARDLSGAITQFDRCGPILTLKIERDPFESFAIRFDSNQLIEVPPAQKMAFAEFDRYCSSASSKPMCAFCEFFDETMECESLDQGIVGSPTSVVHNCQWDRESTMTSSITRPADCPPLIAEERSCPLGAPQTD